MTEARRAPDPREAWTVPCRVVARFKAIPAEQWRQMENNRKARVGKEAFLTAVAGAIDANATVVREWLEGLGLAQELGARWVAVEVADGLTPRWANLGLSSRCVDAFERLQNGELRGVELKVSGNDGVSGLTLGEERLLRAGAIRVLAVNPVRGMIGEMDAGALLAVPRRTDGIPVGEARVEWLGEAS
jgi:hypothetical protein